MPNEVQGKGFNAQVGLGLDLVFQFDGAVEASGGFQLTIPDGSQLGFDIDLGADPATGIHPSADVKTLYVRLRYRANHSLICTYAS